MDILFQIIIAALSVTGFYFCLKTIASLIFTSRPIAATISVEGKGQIEDIDLLLTEASSALFAVRRRRIAVIIPENVWNTCNKNEKKFAEEMINNFGAELFFIDTVDS